METRGGEGASTDVLAEELPLSCLPFDRPPLAPTEAHRIGLELFHASYGYAGLSLAAWEVLRARALAYAPEGDLEWGVDSEVPSLRRPR